MFYILCMYVRECMMCSLHKNYTNTSKTWHGGDTFRIYYIFSDSKSISGCQEFCAQLSLEVSFLGELDLAMSKVVGRFWVAQSGFRVKVVQTS